MNVVTTKVELKRKIAAYKKQNKSIGFVPTMGFLHEGHLKLIEEARKGNDIVILSIFVNPLQFGPNEDFESYPRAQQRDEELANSAGVDLVFLPSVNEMYPQSPGYTISVQSRVNVLCGKSRVGHFDGVATILTKLFHLIEPNRAYFGMKDAQQVAVVEGLVEELNFPLEIVPVSTIREADGLAKSSRNVYLNEEERREAPSLYRSLVTAKEEIVKGNTDFEEIKAMIKAYITQNTSGVIDYIEILTYPQLEEIKVPKGKVIIALAVKFSKARLIDNITVEI